MGQETVDIGNIIRQIEMLQQGADRLLKLAYQSADGKGKVNEGLLQQGQALLKQAEQLIEQNIVPILQGLNPAAVASALTAELRVRSPHRSLKRSVWRGRR